ncbi:molybdopterin-synthase adenylyltransferase MoeB [Sphingomonas psychrotolerans]|uniref:Molybdopterin-synthase adenylyltransferase MoeB n=1 Tax=Sphingomonas psychrotolerans TaxID=1327635 RepID=A0ABU3N5H5_9SPHN|nr:molybdopterin-synthase adenylyltransferase MoeB [Sphingomonas psychrotolerans]MDT8759742.1 molybdopterin-synthase adenylyltransferase MoeB [Sphingomonas psychrotolerans]
MSLTDAQLDRYARHIVLREVGGAGQMRLLRSHVLLIGAGGIGSPAIQYLAAAGVGRISVIDDDDVALSNLQRQTLYGNDQIGTPKVAAAAAAVARLNPDVRLDPIGERIGPANAARLLDSLAPDAILDGSDNFATRLAVADAALAACIPLISAAVAEFEGQLGTFRGWEPDKPCYRCFVGGDPERPEVTCAEQGVLGALTGVMGSLAALETIRAITPFGEDSAGKLLLVDALSLRFRSLALPKDPGCPGCSRLQIASSSSGTMPQPSNA